MYELNTITYTEQAIKKYHVATERNRSKHTWKTAIRPHLGKIQITMSKQICFNNIL